MSDTGQVKAIIGNAILRALIPGIPEAVGKKAAADILDELHRAGLAIVPREATPSSFLQGGNVAISNVGRDGRGRKGRIGDQAAWEAYEIMVAIEARHLLET
jgi:hypothetical protein